MVTREDVLKLAALSSLALDDKEADGLTADIESILGYVRQLDELDTAGVEPTYQVTDLSNVYRDDEIIDYGVSREGLLVLSPDVTGTGVKVPKVL